MKPGFLDRMEKKLGRYAIHNLSLYLIICYAFGYIIQIVNADFFAYLTLEPIYIMQGQIWRLVTWILVPPSSMSIFTLLMLYFYYSIGSNMEKVWGAFRYNVYLFSGMLFTILGAFLVFALYYFAYGITPTVIGYFVSTYYVSMSILLAYAATFPNMQIVMILFIFPVPMKVKWLGILYGVMMVISALQSNMVGRIMILASLLNFILFFLTSRNRMYASPKEVHRRQVYKQQVKKAQPITKHKCAVCGRTDASNPELEFRFCSKCNGNYEYCQDHLFTHEHVK
ncbi:MAG: hypothetical protein IJP31_05090 [Lachnospiraceae bacterium]|nr:hypothetical protein [Lachnospiraceae bacterium]